MLAEDGGHPARVEALPQAIAACPARLWVVSNEVGWGVVPDNALARRFRDEAGRLHQRVAELAEEVVLVVAGLPLRLKPAPT
jgi:adenosylcobinamide kinase/adenosylcobinamide-phosphate guanylyltransferase